MGDKTVTDQVSVSETTLPLLEGSTTLAEALEEEENMLVRLRFPTQRADFFLWVYQHRKDFEAVVSDHLGLHEGEICRLGDPKEWKHGSFNLCVPMHIHNWRKHGGKRVMLRIPLPYRVGESTYPGNAEEKLRTEAATFIRNQGNYPDVSIPFFWGFGLPGGQSFVRLENESFLVRLRWHVRRIVSLLLGGASPCPYVAKTRQRVLEHGYLIMDYIEERDGRPLSESWAELHRDPGLRMNLFRGLSRIMLSLSQSPMPLIGSWTIDKHGILSLTNRPLFHQFQSLENENIPTGVPRELTYATTDAFYADLLACHDSRIRNQPNSIRDERDGLAQMANLFAMRGLLPHFTARDLRNGPFVFTLTDLRPPNIFVDSKWNVKYVIDLEWGCSLPIEMLAPPYWITDHGVDELEGKELEEFDQARQQFLEVFEEEEKSYPPLYGCATYRTNVMKRGWQVGSFWYLHALLSPKGCFNLFRQCIQPIFDEKCDRDAFTKVVSPYWAPDVHKLIEAKLGEKKKYEQELRMLFEKSAGETDVH